MGIGNPPWVDGEKIPDDAITSIFQPQPEVPTLFSRSTLVIGSRGVGKTTLLRYLRKTHKGVAVHISLAEVFAPLTKQTACGPFTFDLPGPLEAGIAGKAASLLAFSIAEKLLKKEISVDPAAILECCPDKLRMKLSPHSGVKIFFDEVINAPLESFDRFSDARPLCRFLTSVGESCQASGSPLLLLLDRADTVVAASLVPVFELLDQSSQYVALLAMRPGHSGQALIDLHEQIIPGDHYGVVHLGLSPRSAEWGKLANGAVEAQLGLEYRQIPDEIKVAINFLSRDSLRTNLDLCARFCSANTAPADELLRAVEDMQAQQLIGAASTLQRYHPDFRRLVNDTRALAVGSGKPLRQELLLTIRPSPGRTLFEVPNTLNRFIDLALRTGAICMPTGERWYPGTKPATVEITPILAWQKVDRLDIGSGGASSIVSLREAEIFSDGGRSGKPPTVFVAYRMGVQESIAFRSKLETAIRSHSGLSEITITDGKSHAGLQWAERVRKNIQGAKLIVGDVSGLSREVFFELGFAYGLKKPVIPVVAHADQLSSVPYWLRGTQHGSYSDHASTMQLLSSIAALLADPEFASRRPLSQPVPGLAVWIRRSNWASLASEQFRASGQRAGLRVELHSDGIEDESLIKRAASASLFCTYLDGGDDDALVHYICGAIAAKPKAGGLKRHIIIVTREDRHQTCLVAESLRRCGGLVTVSSLEEVSEHVRQFGIGYNLWAKRGAQHAKA